MQTFFLSKTDLLALIGNARWFAGYTVRWKATSTGRYRVHTNYPWKGGLANA